MKIKTIFLFFLVFMMLPILVFPITLVRVGYIDLDIIIRTYTEKYLDTEISMREEYVLRLQENYNANYFSLSEVERNEIQLKIRDQRSVLNLLRYNKYIWQSTEELRDDIVYQIMQKHIMEAIKKTSELEGFNLILDNTGNFVYGSEDIDLTDKVLFRLDEKLLNLQDSEPLFPLSLELEEFYESSEFLTD